jgi:SAM-dependent methyltransferase
MSSLFDLSEQYAEMLNKGIRLSGEDQFYFIEGRLRDLLSRLPVGFKPRHILDFGCGIGDTSKYLSELFPSAQVLGVDTAAQAIRYAQVHHANSHVRFETIDSLPKEGHFDLAYCNGVFHHIPPAQRQAAAVLVYRSLAPGGRFALFENNPLSPGARMVMKRIPFDRDAKTLYAGETTRMLKESGFQQVLAPRFLFYFPRQLAALRFSERWLTSLPFGAQYYALAIKSDDPG